MSEQGHEATEGLAETPGPPEPDTSLWVIWWTIIQPDGSFQEVIHGIVPGGMPDAEELAQAQVVMAEKMAEVWLVPMVRQLHTLSINAAERLRATIRGAVPLGQAAAEPRLRISCACFPSAPSLDIPLARQIPKDENEE